jgi:L-threonylcarbamoyladenylate synthase
MSGRADLIRHAAQVLGTGGLVAFPTETVYGLGADARNANAVEKIFRAKGRPPTNPLIVHVATAEIAQRYAAVWPDSARRLTKAFWPGPLTLVLPKTDEIVPQATAGRPTVALRAPDHDLAQQLLREFDGPIAAPSANRSTRPSPTTAAHVRNELGNGVDIILDGGPCAIGIESTVLDLTGRKPTILRPGGLAINRIEQIIGPVDVFAGSVSPEQAAIAPGMQELHYAPTASVHRFTMGNIRQIEANCRSGTTGSVAILAIAGSPEFQQLTRSFSPEILVDMPSNPEAYAQRLYAALHDADARNVNTLWIQEPPDTPAWYAIRDRITRAAQKS